MSRLLTFFTRAPNPPHFLPWATKSSPFAVSSVMLVLKPHLVFVLLLGRERGWGGKEPRGGGEARGRGDTSLGFAPHPARMCVARASDGVHGGKDDGDHAARYTAASVLDGVRRIEHDAEHGEGHGKENRRRHYYRAPA